MKDLNKKTKSNKISRLLVLLAMGVSSVFAVPYDDIRPSNYHELFGYKMFGGAGISLPSNTKVWDPNGYIGTRGNLSTSNTGQEIHGNVLIGGNISNDWNIVFTDGYVHVGGDVVVNSNSNTGQNHMDEACILGTVSNASKLAIYTDHSPNCPAEWQDLPTVSPVSVPTMDNHGSSATISRNNGSTYVIDLDADDPGDATSGNRYIDILLNSISLTNGSKIQINVEPSKDEFVRIFVNSTHIDNGGIYVFDKDAGSLMNAATYNGSVMVYSTSFSLNNQPEFYCSLVTPGSLSLANVKKVIGQVLADGTLSMSNANFSDALFSGGGFEPFDYQTNNAPSDLALAPSTIEENNLVDDVIGTLTTTDADAGDSHTYSLVAGAGDTDNARVYITGAVVYANAAYDYEADQTLSIRVQTDDGNGGTYEEALTITIGALNDNTPAIDAAQVFYIAEDAADGASVTSDEAGTTPAAVSATDADLDVGNTLENWVITGGTGSALFAIDASGQITLITAGSIDYENTTSYTLTIEVDDDAGLHTAPTQTVTINVSDANDETPAVDAGQTLTVDENTALTTVIGTLTATDADAGTSFSGWTITGGTGSALFDIDPASGEVSVAGALDYEVGQSYTLTVTVSDGSNTSLAETVDVTIGALNDNTPAVDAGQTFSVAEDAANGFSLGSASGTDADLDVGNTLQSWTIISGNTGSVFAIDAATGELTVGDNSALDYETLNSYTLVVTVGDGTFTSAQESITITVTNTNDEKPIVDAGQTLAVDENTALTTVIGTLTASDPDGATVFSDWTITGGTGLALFAVDAATGEVSVAGALDYETAQSYTLTVTVNDGVAGSDAETVTVNIGALNDNTPAVDVGQTFIVAEDAANGFSLGSASGTDADLDVGNTLQSWAIVSGNEDGVFGLNAASGEISVVDNTLLDYESQTSYTLVVRVGDGTFNSATQSVTINVSDANDEIPAVDAGQTLSVDENTAATTVIGTLTATDADAGSVFSGWEITGGSGQGVFVINAATGAVSVAGALDYELAQSYTLNVRVSDGSNTSSSETVSVTIGALNDNTPVVDNGLSYNVTEGAANGTSLGTVSASDADLDVGNTLQAWSIVSGNDDGIFALNAATGEVTIADNSALDYESAQSYTLVLNVGDGDFTSDNQSISISVSDENDAAPVVDPGLEFHVSESAANGTLIGTLTGTDADVSVGNILQGWSIVSGNAAGMFALNAASGQLTLADNSALNYESVTSYTITVRVTDGTFTSAAESVRIIVDDENDEQPAVNVGQSFALDENTAVGTSVGTLLATDGDAGTTFSSWAIVSGNTNSAFAINAATGEITVAGSLDYETLTAYTLSVTVSDGANVSAPQNVTINLNPLNDINPVVGVGQSYDVSETATVGTVVGTVNASDADLVVGNILQSWQIVSGNGDGVFAINNSTGRITIADVSALDYETASSYTIGLQVGDGDFNSAVQTITIAINDENDEAPVVNAGQVLSVDENSAAGTVVGTIRGSDADAGAVLTGWTIVSGNTSSVFTLNPSSGVLTVAGSLDYETTPSYTLSVRVSDGVQNSALVNVLVNVNDLNESPVVDQGIDDQTTPEDAAWTFTIPADAFADVDGGDVLAYSLGGNVPSWISFDAASATFSGTPENDDVGVISIIVQAEDQAGNQVSDSFTLEVTNVNDDPEITTTGFTLDENTGAGTVIGQIAAIDVDGDPLTWTLLDGSEFVSLNASGELTVSGTIDYEANPSITIRVRVEDDQGGFAEADLELTVTNETESSSVEITMARADGQTWYAPDTVWTNAEEVEIFWEEDGNRRLDTAQVPDEGPYEVIRSYQAPSVDYAGADTVLILVNRQEPRITYPAEPIVYPEDPNLISEDDLREEEEVQEIDTLDNGDLVYPSNNVPDTLEGRPVHFVNSDDTVFTALVEFVGEDLQWTYDNLEFTGELREGTEGQPILNEVIAEFTDPYGNFAAETLWVVLDTRAPVVEITRPADSTDVRLYVIDVTWTVNGQVMDQLTQQSLEEGWNEVIRSFRDRVGNVASDTILVHLEGRRSDVLLALEDPMIEMDPEEVDELYAVNPPEEGETFSLSVYNVDEGVEEELQWGSGSTTNEGDGSEPYPGNHGRHLGPTLRVEVRIPHIGGYDAAGNPRGGDLQGMMSDDDRIVLNQGTNQEQRLSVGEFVDQYCVEDAFGDLSGQELLEAALSESELQIELNVYDNIGQFVDRIEARQLLNQKSYVSDAGIVTLYMELKPGEDRQLHTSQGGRSYGTGVFIISGLARVTTEHLCDTPDGRAGSVQTTNEPLLTKFGYQRFDK
jgi:hypothetical protein